MATKRTICALSAGAALLAVACGDEGPAPSGRSMSAPGEARSAAAEAARPNAAPRVTGVTITPSQPHSRELVRAQATALDADGDSTQLRFVWRVGGETLSQGGAFVMLPELAKDSRVEVEVVANDGRLDSEPASASARVRNRAPVISAVRFDRAEQLRAGDPVVAIVDVEDPDGDAVELAYRWIVNERVVELDADTDRFDTSKLRRDDRIAVRVVASDGDDESEGFDTPTLILGNGAPTISSTPPPGMGSDGIYRYAVEASDPDRDRGLRYRLASAPEGARVDPVMGEITWQPTFQQAGTHPIEVVVTDGHGGETKQRFEVTVKEVVEAAAQPPASP